MLAAAPPPLVSDDDWLSAFGAAPTVLQAARIAAASASVRSACNWHIAPVVEQTFTVDSPGGRMLTLPTLRLVEVLAVSQNGVDVDVDTLEWSHDGYLRGVWVRRLQGVQVTIRHGFDAVPDLLMVVADLSARAQLVRRKAIGQRSVEFQPPGLLEYEIAQLAAYALPVRT